MDWFDENAPKQDEDWFAQNAPKVAEPPKQEGGVISGIVAGLGRALNPVNLVKGALDLGQPSDISKIYNYGKTLGEIVTGTPPDEAIGKNIPELQQQRETAFGQHGTKEQAAYWTGAGLQLGLVAAPFLHGRLKGAAPEVAHETPMAEVAGIAKPDPAIAPEVAAVEQATTEAATQPGQFTTNVEATADQSARNLEGTFEDLRTQGADLQERINTQRTAASSAPIPEEQVSVNREIAPVTEPPSATAEPFPSISASAEEARRAELQQEPPKVREAISIDEIRLMRERTELEAQNDIARQATGGTHPAVDERLGQIDEELTNIANKELQPAGTEPAPSDATYQEQFNKRYGRSPTEAELTEFKSREGGTKNAEQVTTSTQPNGDVLNVPRPEEIVSEVPAAVGSEGVPQGRQGETLPAAKEQVVPLTEPPIVTPETPAGTGISNQRLTEAYGDAAPVATTGKGPGAWKDEGLSRLDSFQKTGDVNHDPYSVLTTLREGQTTVSLPSDVSLLRAEHQRLLEDARNAEGTPEYADKSKAALDMATAIKDVAHGPASDVFRALQEYDKPRYDNVTDFDQALRERLGRESTLQEKTQFKKMADDVASTRNGAEKEINSVQKRISKLPKMSFDDAFKNIHDQITQLTKDCVL